ncbi:hypothetical protein JCM6882_000893 [Rhodosporidiobolus microsporus]
MLPRVLPLSLIAASLGLTAALPLSLSLSPAASFVNDTLPANADTALERRWVTGALADGYSMQYGQLSDQIKWQSSGQLLQGCDASTGIGNCYTIKLQASGQLQKRAVSRQRVEFLSIPYAQAGESWQFSWRQYLQPGVASSEHFFILSQLLSREYGGPCVQLSLISGRIHIVDHVDGRCGSNGCPSIAQEEYWGRTTHHWMEATFGENGRVYYGVTDASTGEPIISYSFSNSYLHGDTSLKCGIYRAAVDTNTYAEAYVGDFWFAQVA